MTDQAKTRKSLLHELFSYWIWPHYGAQLKVLPRGKKFRDIFRLWSFSAVIIFGIGLIIAEVMERTGYDLTQHSVVDLFLNQSTYVILFLVFLWAPITEELTFRLGLRYSPYRLGFSIVFFATILAGMGLVLFNDFFESFIDWIYLYSRLEILAAYIFVVAGFGVGFGFIIKKRADHARIEKFYRKNFQIIFYSLALLFGSVHLFNFLNLGEIWYLAIILVMPQLLLGLVLGYVRMFYGIVWAVLFHFLHNAIISFPIILLSYISEDTFKAMTAGDTEKLNNLPAGDSFLILIVAAFSIFVIIAAVVSLVILIVEYYRFRRGVNKNTTVNS